MISLFTHLIAKKEGHFLSLIVGKKSIPLQPFLTIKNTFSNFYLDDGQLEKLDEVVTNCKNADGNDKPSAGHLGNICIRGEIV